MKLSIITINYNNVDGLRKTMESVFAQTCKDFEYIVVDGASTDGSVDVIRELEQKHLSLSSSLSFPFLWVSEKDTGIYNAMNKGIEIALGRRNVDNFNRSELVEDKNKGVRKANGEYVLMLNSGDYFVDEHVIERILPELDGTDVLQGNIVICKDGISVVDRGYGRSDISFLDAFHGHFLHQAAFCRKDLFDKYGFFDESYRYVSDTIFFVKTLGYGDASFKYVDVNIANFDLTGYSNSLDPNILASHKKEEVRMYNELFPGKLLNYILESEKKILMYDSLRESNWLWKVVMFLKLIKERLH